MDDVLADLLIGYRSLCAKAGVEPLPQDDIEAWLRASLADNIIGGAIIIASALRK